MVGANWDVTTDLALHRELERAKILAEARNAELEAAKARIEHIALHDYLTDRRTGVIWTKRWIVMAKAPVLTAAALPRLTGSSRSTTLSAIAPAT